MNTHELLLTAWDKDPFVIGVSTAVLIAYAVWVRGRLQKRALGFAIAAALFVLALASPIGVLARGYLFSAHMLQHILLVLVVPPLALLSLPSLKYTTKTTEKTAHTIRLFLPWIMGVGAMWLWHAPMLCDAASRSLSVSHVQTVSLVLMGGAFWWPILGPRADQRFAPFAAMVYLFTACIACTALGILVTFSPIEVCSVYAHPLDRLGALPLLRDGWGLTPKVDQEIGGLLMWVPGCFIYAMSILLMYARYSREPEPEVTSEPILDPAATHAVLPKESA